MSKKNKDQKPEKVEIKTFEDLKEALNDAERMEEAYNEQAAEDQKLSEVLTAASDLVPTEEELSAAQKTRLVIDLDRGTRKVEQEKPAEPQQVEMKMAADKHRIDPDELKEELDKEDPAEKEVEKPKWRMKACVGIASDGFLRDKDPSEYGTFESSKSSLEHGLDGHDFGARKTRIVRALRKHEDLLTDDMKIDTEKLLAKYAELYKVSEKAINFIKNRINDIESDLREIVLWEIKYNVALVMEPVSVWAFDVYAPEYKECVFTSEEIIDVLQAAA